MPASIHMAPAKSGIFQWPLKDFLQTDGERTVQEFPPFLFRENSCFLRIYSEINYTKTVKVEFNVTAQIQAAYSLQNVTYFKACFLARDGGQHFIQEIYICQRERKFCVTFSYDEAICSSMIEQKDEFLEEGAITFQLLWNVQPHRLVPIQAEGDLISETERIKSLDTLSNDFSRLYESKKNTDCVLKVGDVQFPVHRAVLSARSEVFSAMFQHDTSENRSGEVDIQDVDDTALSYVLQYLYSGQIPKMSVDTANLVHFIANKYALVELKRACLDVLEHNLTIENVCEIALQADMHNETDLEKKVVQFVKSRWVEIKETDQWKELSLTRPLLGLNLLSSALMLDKK